MASRQKTAAARKRSPSRSSSKNGKSGKNGKSSRSGAWRRFLISFSSTTVVVFGVASYLLNPQLVETLRHRTGLSSYLPRISWPSATQGADVPSLPGVPSVPGVQNPAPPVAVAPGHTVARFAQCPQFFPAARVPQLPAGEHLRELCFNAFAVLYNGRTKTPLVVVERLNRATLVQARQQHRTDRFYPEARLPRAERAELEDYRGSGYSRGHMAPAGDMGTPEAMAQSFSLANMVPQNQVHNAGAWSHIEQDTRKYVMRARGDVFVYTGPLFDARPPTVGRGRVMVPAQLFKLVYDASSGKAWAYVQANRADTRAGAPVSYGDFVRRTGLRLLPPAAAGGASS